MIAILIMFGIISMMVPSRDAIIAYELDQTESVMNEARDAGPILIGGSDERSL